MYHPRKNPLLLSAIWRTIFPSRPVSRGNGRVRLACLSTVVPLSGRLGFSCPVWPHTCRGSLYASLDNHKPEKLIVPDFEKTLIGIQVHLVPSDPCKYSLQMSRVLLGLYQLYYHVIDVYLHGFAQQFVKNFVHQALITSPWCLCWFQILASISSWALLRVLYTLTSLSWRAAFMAFTLFWTTSSTCF